MIIKFAVNLTSPDLAISLQGDTGSQVVQDQSLVGLRDSQFPWQPSVFDASPATGSCPSIMTRYGDVLSFTLRNSTTE